MSVTDLRLLDPSRKDLIAALQAAAKAANFRRRTGRLTLAAADCEGLVSLSTAQSQEAAEGDGGPDAQRRGEAVQAAGGGLELRAGHVDRRDQRRPASAASSSGFVCGRAPPGGTPSASRRHRMS